MAIQTEKQKRPPPRSPLWSTLTNNKDDETSITDPDITDGSWHNDCPLPGPPLSILIDWLWVVNYKCDRFTNQPCSFIIYKNVKLMRVLTLRKLYEKQRGYRDHSYSPDYIRQDKGYDRLKPNSQKLKQIKSQSLGQSSLTYLRSFRHFYIL